MDGWWREGRDQNDVRRPQCHKQCGREEREPGSSEALPKYGGDENRTKTADHDIYHTYTSVVGDLAVLWWSTTHPCPNTQTPLRRKIGIGEVVHHGGVRTVWMDDTAPASPHTTLLWRGVTHTGDKVIHHRRICLHRKVPASRRQTAASRYHST